MEPMKYLLLILALVAVESQANCTTIIISDSYSSTSCTHDYRHGLLSGDPFGLNRLYPYRHHYEYSTFIIDLRPRKKEWIVPVKPLIFRPLLPYDYYKENPIVIDPETDPYGVESARRHIRNMYPENQ